MLLQQSSLELEQGRAVLLQTVCVAAWYSVHEGSPGLQPSDTCAGLYGTGRCVMSHITARHGMQDLRIQTSRAIACLYVACFAQHMQMASWMLQ